MWQSHRVCAALHVFVFSHLNGVSREKWYAGIYVGMESAGYLDP